MVEFCKSQKSLKILNNGVMKVGKELNDIVLQEKK